MEANFLQQARGARAGGAPVDNEATSSLLSLLRAQDIALPPPRHFLLVCEKAGVRLEPESGDPAGRIAVSPLACRAAAQSADGGLLALAADGSLQIFLVESLLARAGQPRCVASAKVAEPLALRFSPSGRLLCLLYTARVELLRVETLARVLAEDTAELAAAAGAAFHLAADERSAFVARDARRLLRLDDDGELFRPVKQLELPKQIRLTQFHALGGGLLLVGSLASKSLLYVDANLNPFTDAAVPGNFHELSLRLCADRSAALLLTTNLLDVSGRSYYGTNQLFLLEFQRFALAAVPCVDGPIHSAQWFPDGRGFLVLAGDMPAHCVLYDRAGRPTASLGRFFRNEAVFAADGAHFALASLGSLSGDVDVWHAASLARLGSFRSNHSSAVRFLPDGRRLLAATLFQKLRGGNCFRLLDLAGAELLRRGLADSELYLVEPLVRNNYALGRLDKADYFAEPSDAAKKNKVANLKREPLGPVSLGVEALDVRAADEQFVAEVNARIRQDIARAEEAKKSLPAEPAAKEKKIRLNARGSKYLAEPAAPPEEQQPPPERPVGPPEAAADAPDKPERKRKSDKKPKPREDEKPKEEG